MARAVVVRDGLVVNVIEAEQGYELPDGDGVLVWLEDGGAYVGPGFSLGPDGVWSAPVVEEPGELEPTPLEQVRADLDWLITYVVTGEG